MQIIITILTIVILLLLIPKTRQKAMGIYRLAVEQTTRKNKNKQKILEMLKNKEELSNSEIRETLGVSRRSVARYMSQLEKENRVEQIGDIGRGVTYRLK